MLNKMLSHLLANGFAVIVFDPSEDDADYVGSNVRDAMDAIEAVDEIEIEMVDEDGEIVGWALIVNGLDEDERIADCSGIVEKWVEEE